MTAVSLQFLIVNALIVSAVQIWLNSRSMSAFAATGVTLALCLALGVAQFFAPPVTRVGIQLWLVFVLCPSVAVLAISRLEFLHTRPWLLLLIGPISFVIAVIFVGTVFNIFFATRHPS